MSKSIYVDVRKEIDNVFDIEIRELNKVRSQIGDSIEKAVNLISTCKGKVVLCGMGKPGHIARKISATMSSVGIASFVIHPAEAMHGDLGMINCNDVIMILSNSGETAEVCNLIPNIKMMSIPIIAITARSESTLARMADCTIITGEIIEAGALGLAPTSSTTAELVIGDAIAATVSKMRNFTPMEFALFHPAGTLGKKLLTTVADVMIVKEKLPIIRSDKSFIETVKNYGDSEYGVLIIVDIDEKLVGIITDGDIKREIAEDSDYFERSVHDVMTKNPVSVIDSFLAFDALKLMEKRQKIIHSLVVVDSEDRVLGLVRNHDIINANIFL